MRLYIHIPFCVKKCDYCDFLSYAGMGEKVSLYLTALKKDIIHTAEELSLRERKNAGVSCAAAADGVKSHTKVSLDSVYIGGGTPGYLSADAIASVMDTVKEHFDIASDAEITIETNPCTVSREKASAYLKAGINRVSMGVQSFNDEVLKTLGRAHNAETAVKAFDILRSSGFENINIDLISCVPGDSKAGFVKSLKTAIGLAPEHISAYELIIEEGTPFYKKYGPKSGYEADEDLESEIYLETERILREAGYDQYEISNFARSGYESKHNLAYWRQEEYVGCGLGAVSGLEINENIPDEGDSRAGSENDGGNRICRRTGWIRKRKLTGLGDYINDPYITEDEMMDKKEAEKEYVILALRTSEGLNTERFEKTYGHELPEDIKDVLCRYSASAGKTEISERLIENSGENYHFTPKGFLVSNSILSEIL